MNYLQLCQRAAIECDISGPGPVSVVGNTGELNRICGWVATALTDLETKYTDWGWMLLPASFATVAGQAQYTPAQCGITADTFGEWVPWRFRNYVTANGNISEVDMDGDCTYDGWRENYNYGATRYTQTRPLVVAIHPNATDLLLGPYPAAGYTVTGEYFRAPQILAADADTPELPAQYHLMLVYMAMQSYGFYESAPEVLARGEREYSKMMQRLEKLRLPPVYFR